MRRRSPGIGMISRAAGFVAVGAAIVATAVHVRRDDIGAGSPAAAIVLSTSSDAIARELARCRALGLAAQNDAVCEAAWTENRRRFFSYRSPDHAMSEPPAARPTAVTPGGK